MELFLTVRKLLEENNFCVGMCCAGGYDYLSINNPILVGHTAARITISGTIVHIHGWSEQDFGGMVLKTSIDLIEPDSFPRLLGAVQTELEEDARVSGRLPRNS
jgi:hypothetical protein